MFDLIFMSFYKKNTKGFTLVEMMVSVSIAMVIMTVVLFSYRAFNDRLALSAAAQEISVAIREAQVYGLSVKKSGTGAGNFDAGYGISIDSADTTSYYLFSDLNNNGLYDGDSSCVMGSECVQKNTLRGGIKIDKTGGICGTAFGGGATVCSPFDVVSLHVTFIRPNPDASIIFIKSSGGPSLKYKTAQITLVSPLGSQARVTIENTGQISVQ